MTLSTHWLEPSVHIPCCKLCFSVVAQHKYLKQQLISVVQSPCSGPLLSSLFRESWTSFVCKWNTVQPFSSKSASHVLVLAEPKFLSSHSPWTWTCHSLLDIGNLLLDLLLVGLCIPDLLSTGHHGYSGFCLFQTSLVCLAVQFVDAGLQGL